MISEPSLWVCQWAQTSFGGQGLVDDVDRGDPPQFIHILVIVGHQIGEVIDKTSRIPCPGPCPRPSAGSVGHRPWNSSLAKPGILRSHPCPGGSRIGPCNSRHGACCPQYCAPWHQDIGSSRCSSLVLGINNTMSTPRSIGLACRRRATSSNTPTPLPPSSARREMGKHACFHRIIVTMGPGIPVSRQQDLSGCFRMEAGDDIGGFVALVVQVAGLEILGGHPGSE